MIWPDLATRARGLSCHLLAADRIDRIDRATDVQVVARELADAGYSAFVGEATADAIDLAIRKRCAADLETLARWAGDRSRALTVVFDDEDRRVLRIIVRGIAGHVPAGRRLSGTIATPQLPERVLASLVTSTSIAELGARLRAVTHPYAEMVCAAGSVEEPVDVLSIETALARCFARRARRHLRGSLALTRLVQQTIDVTNVAAALLLAARGEETQAIDHYVDGGARLELDEFRAAAAAEPTRARALLARRFGTTPVGEALAAPGAVPELETAGLRWQLATQATLRRTDPLGAAPLLWLVLSRRRESRSIRRATWRAALGGAA